MAEKAMKLSSNTAKLHEMFGKNLYSQRYSFVAEVCQNAVDSHRMAGIKDPIRVGIRKEDHRYVFFVKDIGLSFDSREDFEEKVCTLMESGKSGEKTNEEDCPMGDHGIGSISVTRFYDNCEWRYTVVKNGRKFHAKLKEVEGIGLTYEIGDYEETQEEKYVLFEVTIPPDKNHFDSEVAQLIEGMKSKLAYFKDIFFDFDDEVIKKVPNALLLNRDFRLLQSDDFQLSTLSTQYDMHISLDQYSYPIKWDVLGIQRIPLNIALKFGMGDGLRANITREVLRIDEGYKEIVMAKLEKVATWFVERFNKSIPDEFESVKDMIPYFLGQRTVTVGAFSYDIKSLIPYSIVPVKPIKFKGVSDEVFSAFIVNTDKGRGLFDCKYEITSSGKKIKRFFNMYHYNYDRKKAFIMKKEVPVKIMSYIKQTTPGATLFTKKKIGLFRGLASYNQILRLKSMKEEMKLEYKSSGRSIWREKIQQCQILEDSIEKDYFTSIDDIVIPSDFSGRSKPSSINRKAKVDLTELSGEVGLKYAQAMKIYNVDWSCKFVEKVVEVKDLYKIPYLHIYGTESQRELLDKVYSLSGTGNKSRIKAVMVSERDKKYIGKLKLHNFMDVEEFFKGGHKHFGKVVTAYSIHKMMSKYSTIFNYKSIIKEWLSSKFANDLQILEDYSKSMNPGLYINRQGTTDAFMDECVTLMEKCKLYDHTVWQLFKNVEADIEKFDFIDFFSGYISAMTPGNAMNSPSGARAVKAMQDLARQRQAKMTWHHYLPLDK